MIFFDKKYKEDREVVCCSNCCAMIIKADAQKVNEYGMISHDYFYCGKCRKPYSRVLFSNFYKEIRVDDDGEPIGYVKQENKKN